MEQPLNAASAHEANRFFAATRYIYQFNQTCYDKCVVDFQTKDIGPLEKECAKACLKKHMTIYKDLVK
jgi:hypothetical protein